MFFKRYYRRGSRRRFFRRSLKRSSGVLNVNNDNSYRFLVRKPRRLRRVSRGLRSAIYNVLGSHHSIRTSVGAFDVEPNGSYAGTTINYWINSATLYALYDFARNVQQNRYGAALAGSNILNRNWNFGIKIHKIGYIIEVVNQSNYPIDVRCNEFFAKRDIPSNTCTDGTGAYVFPPLRMYLYENSGGGRPSQNPGVTATWPTNQYVYTHFLNRYQSFRTVQFWFRNRVTKTAKLQPGASMPVTWLYTPKIGLWPSQMFYTSVLGQDLGSTAAGYGWGMLKGLNGSGMQIETRGLPAVNNSTAALTTTPSALRLNVTFVCDMTMVPFREDSTYSSLDASYQVSLANVHASGVKPVNQQTVSIY